MVRPGPVGGSESFATEESARIAGRKRPIRAPSQMRSVVSRREKAIPSAPPSGSREDDKDSAASTSHKHDDSDRLSSDSESPPVGNFSGEEVDAASSLATIFLAAAEHSKLASSPSSSSSGKRQPLSAPAALQSHGEDGGDLDPLLHKKQRRREKNRESAQQSRQRKKCHLETLELRVAQLESERAALQQTLHSLTAENQSLKAHIASRNSAASALEERRGSDKEATGGAEDGAKMLLEVAMKKSREDEPPAHSTEEAQGAGREESQSPLAQLAVAATLTHDA